MVLTFDIFFFALQTIEEIHLELILADKRKKGIMRDTSPLSAIPLKRLYHQVIQKRYCPFWFMRKNVLDGKKNRKKYGAPP